SPGDPAPPRTPCGPRRDRSGRAWLSNPHLDVAKPCGRGPVPHSSDLAGLALAAVRRAPQHPLVPSSDRVARAPELRGDARVVRALVQLGELAVLDPPGHLASELEV